MTARDSKKPSNEEVALEELFKAVEDVETTNEDESSSTAKPLLRLFLSSNTSRSIIRSMNMRDQKALLLDAVRKMTKTQARRFFAGLKATLEIILLENREFVSESSSSSDGGEEDDSIISDLRSSEALQALKIMAELVHVYYDEAVEQHKPKKTPVPIVSEAFDVAQSLHDILFQLSTCGREAQGVQAAISTLCETWWLTNGARREHLVVQTVPLLAIASLSQKTDVKRLFQMRKALEIIDFEDPSSDSLRGILLRIVSSPVLLKMSEGKRFIAFLFHVDPNLMRDVHQAIRVQVPDAKKSVLDAYGDVYLRAWKEAPSEEVQELIENQVLTDLMYAVIHVAKADLSKAIMTLLEPIHDSQKNPEVESLLYRMYGPILWRSLSAANYQVRVQATRVLAEVFPLQNPSHTQTKEAVRKGTDALSSLMKDKHPDVRVAASEAVSRVLSMYWDVIPPTEIRALINHLVAEHASDASSSNVRASALNAISLLLENKKTHAVLRPLLPAMGNLIHDKVEKVRVAAIQMLLRIKKTKGIKYYHVVPVDHLTSRLADEGKRNPNNSVASGLTALMLNSYFPSGPKVSGSDQIKRTLTFLSNDPAAASVFYCNLHSHLSVGAVAKLAAMLLQCLHTAVLTDQKRAEKLTSNGQKRRRTSQQEDEAGAGDSVEDISTISAENTPLMANLAETICVLWQSIETELSNDEESSQFLVDAFSGSILTTALNHFERKAAEVSEDEKFSSTVRDDCYRTCAAILRSAGRLPAKAVEGLVSHISSMLSKLNIDGEAADMKQNVSAHIALLCLWDMTDEVAPSLANSIEAAFEGDHELLFGSPEPMSRKRKPGASKKKNILAVPPLPPRLALGVLEDILRGLDPSSVAARESILESQIARNAIEKSLERGIRYAERLLAKDVNFCQSLQEKEIDYVLRVCEVYGRVALHGEAVGDKKIVFGSQASRLLQWTTSKVVGSLVARTDAPLSPFDDPDVSRISVNRSILSSPLSPIPTGPVRRRPNRNMTPGKAEEAAFRTPSKKKAQKVAQDISKAFAVSLMQSSCFIFSEWLAVGGTGYDMILEASLQWSEVLDTDEIEEEVKLSLLNGFCRLSAQLVRTSNNFRLVEKLLESRATSKDVEIIGKLVHSLVSFRRDLTAEHLSQCVRNAAYSFLEKNAIKIPSELPESFSDLIPDAELLCNSVATVAAAGSMGSELGDILGRDVLNESLSPRVRLFAARWLWLLCDENLCKDASVVSKKVRKIDVSLFDDENPLKDLMGEVVSSA